MAGGMRGGNQTGRHGGHVRTVHPLLVACLVIGVIAYQTTRCSGQCASSDRPTMMRVRRRHLPELSVIASHILGFQVDLPDTFTDTQMQILLETMREKSPQAVADFEEAIGSEFTRILDGWIWRCRAPQTLGKRRKRDNQSQDLA